MAPARRGSNHSSLENVTTAKVFSNVEHPSAIRRKNVSSACDGCKKTRSKCSGDRPCEKCQRSNIECTYQKTQDGRLKESRKRKVQDLENDSEILTGLIEFIKAGGDTQIAQIVALIQSNASIPEVKVCIQQQIVDAHQSRRETSPELHYLHGQIRGLERDRAYLTQSLPLHRRKPMDIARLTDSPPYQVPASPWTTVTDDDSLVSNLVSVWLTWEKPFYNWFDQDTFLDGMVKGQLDATYCSPFMVNALLAVACFCSDYEETRTIRGRPPQIMLDFIEDAQRFLKQETNGPSITKAQGLALLFLAESTNGRDNEGHAYLKQAAVMSKELEDNYTHLDESSATSDEERKLVKSLDLLSWGIFNLSIMVFHVLHSVPEILVPRRKLPPSYQEDLIWCPYPRPGPELSNHTSELFHYQSSLALIVRDICDIVYSRRNIQRTGSETHVEAMVRLCDRLLGWEKSRPAHLRPTEQSASSVFTHQCYYLYLVMSTFALLKHEREDNPTESTLQAREAPLKAAMEVAQLCKRHQILYGNKHVASFVQQTVLLALYTFVDESDITQFHAEILSLCIYLRVMSRRWPFTFVALRMFQVAIHERGKRLPEGTEKLFEEFERLDWNVQVLDNINSVYPVIGDINDGRTKTRRWNDFIGAMARLNVATGSQDQQPDSNIDSDEHDDISTIIGSSSSLRNYGDNNITSRSESEYSSSSSQ